MRKPILLLSAALFLFIQLNTQAALILNSGQTITHQVTINPIVVSDDGGANTATFFGNLMQQGQIESFIDNIWAQAGIDVVFKAITTYNSTFALEGSPESNDPRPTTDLSTVVSNATSAGGILDPDSNVLNMFLVNISAGFSALSANSAAGLAFTPGNGITQYVGETLLTFDTGREVIASVVAHEIGHNLGLPHIVEVENLMQEGGAPNSGERLNSSQISTAQASSFSVAIPEPSTTLLLVLGAGTLVLSRRRVG